MATTNAPQPILATENGKDQKDSAAIDATEKDGKATPDLLNMLAFIAEMQSKRRNVSVPLERLSAVGYGPNEWSFRIAEKLESRYTVVSPGNRANALIIRNPLVDSNFSSIDEFLEHMITCVDKVVDKCLTLYREAPNTSLSGMPATNPEDLGVPLTKMCELEPAHENICATVQPYCATQRMRNPNYSTGHIAEGLDFNPLREAFFTLSRDEMRPFRDIIINFEHFIRQEKPNSQSYRNLLPNDVLHIVANPFRLNAIFDHLPMATHYYSELVWELTAPELSVVPMTPSQMIINSTQSMSKLTTLNSFASINERPHMDNAIGFYVMSMLCPGSVNFLINLEDIPKDDIYLRFLSALACKLLFAYNANQRWNSLSECSVREVEAAIARAGTTSGVLDHFRVLSRSPNVEGESHQ